MRRPARLTEARPLEHGAEGSGRLSCFAAAQDPASRTCATARIDETVSPSMSPRSIRDTVEPESPARLPTST